MTDPAEAKPGETILHCGMTTLVGRANVGKSTLVNRVLEEKVSIVSPVVQTTRHVVRAILTEPRGQIVFLDTPGIHKPLSDLGKTMNRLARTSVEGVDAVLLVLDASSPPEPEDEGWMRRLLFEEPVLLAVLNKVDRPSDHREAYRSLWDRLREEKDRDKDMTWLETSALDGRGVQELVDVLFRHMPPGPLLFPADIVTDFPRNLILSDLIREKFFLVLRDELPHHIAVGIENLTESDAGWSVDAVVVVNKPTQKGIVIGKKGKLLKRVCAASEKDIRSIYEVPVRLRLRVKVEKNWTRNHFLLRQLGYRE
jgi:GTP-binding protein Era